MILIPQGYGVVYKLREARGIPEGIYLRLGENHWYKENDDDFIKVTNTNILIALKAEYQIVLDNDI